MNNLSLQFYQSLLIFLVVSSWVFIAVGLIEYFQWHSVSGLLIHSGIILIALVCVAVIIKSLNFLSLLSFLGLNKADWRYYLFAILLAAIIWIADWWLQLFYFLDNGKNDSLALQNEIKTLGVFNVVLASCLLAPIAEEILFRGILLKGFLEKLNTLGAILISSFLFAAIHFSVQDFISLFVASFCYAFLTIKAQSIQPAIFAHLINNSVTVYYLSIL